MADTDISLLAEHLGLSPLHVQRIWDIHAANFGLHNRTVRKTADQTVTNSIVLVNDTDLFLPIAANEVWIFRMYLINNSHATADFDAVFSIPAGASGLWAFENAAWGATTITTEVMANGSSADTLCSYYGIIINGATPGNLQLQWAQNTQHASDCIVRTNSCLIARKVA